MNNKSQGDAKKEH